jgi:6-pyruvoyltetrahydropterin/6-carboxytetrahydropterin synthase
MVRLTRTVRFSINPEAAATGGGRKNGFAGHPTMQGLGRYYTMDVEAIGEPDPVTGYLVNIQTIDRAVRDVAVPLIAEACAVRPETDPASLVGTLLEVANDALGGSVERLRWWLTPTYAVEKVVSETDSVLIRQRFDFAAAHRLHSPELSDEKNREVYGHCNNPAGHGHNYQIEVVVRTRLTESGPRFTLLDLERVAIETVIDRFDHTHLNVDTEEFGPSSSLMTSVENIARVCHDLLKPVVEQVSGGDASLHAVTVWETDRTCCTYPS